MRDSLAVKGWRVFFFFLGVDLYFLVDNAYWKV